MNQRNFDERQLLARSRAFQYAFFTFMGTLVVWEFLCDLLELTAAPMGELWLLLCPPLLVFSITCIVRDAYDPIQSRPGMIVFTLLPVAALIICIDKLRDHTPLIEGKYLTEDGGLMVLELGILVIAVVYWICYIRSGRESEEE